jgi:hypothetical protein
VSVTVDANILIYATNADDDLHGQAAELLQRLAAGPDLLYLFWPTIMGFLRIATHPAIFSEPLAPAEAVAAVSQLLVRPNVRTAAEGSRFWDAFVATAGPQSAGNHVPDAHIASLMREHGVAIIYTRDRDFRRYDGIEPRDPFV